MLQYNNHWLRLTNKQYVNVNNSSHDSLQYLDILLSIIGKILSTAGNTLEHNKYFLWAVQHSTIGKYLSIISSTLLTIHSVITFEKNPQVAMVVVQGLNTTQPQHKVIGTQLYGCGQNLTTKSLHRATTLLGAWVLIRAWKLSSGPA